MLIQQMDLVLTEACIFYDLIKSPVELCSLSLNHPLLLDISSPGTPHTYLRKPYIARNW